MINQWLIERTAVRNFVGHWLLIHVIDYSLISVIIHWCHWLFIDYPLVISPLKLLDNEQSLFPA